MQVLSNLAEQYPSSQSLIIQADAVENSQLIAAFAKGKEVFGHIDVVFNNACIASIIDMQSLSFEEASEVFESRSASNVTMRSKSSGK